MFQGAYAAARTPRTAGQLGLSEMSVGYWVQAEAHLAEALDFPTHPWVAKNLDGLRTMLAKARHKIVDITVTGSPTGSEVRVNGHPAGTLPLPKPLRLGEGRIEIQLSATGHKTEVRTLSAIGGEKMAIEVNLESESAGGQPKAEQPERPRDQAADGSSSRTEPFAAASSETRTGAKITWPAWATAGAGVLAFGFGAVELYLWRRDQNAFDTHLATTPATHHDCGEQEQMRGGPGCQDLYDGAVRSRTLAVVGFAAGVGLGVASVLLWRSSHEPQKSEQAFACTPQLADPGVECLWRF
jgi:hypothetical protein